LEPAWGDPELLMNLAFANLNRATPDVDTAERYAERALALCHIGITFATS
jgi:hypothetical protein